MTAKQYRISKSIRERFKVFTLKPEDLARLSNVGLEHFDYLKLVDKIDFTVFFRVDLELLEFITPENFSHELVNRILSARNHDYDNLDICVKQSDLPRFERLIDEIRRRKMKNLHEQDPKLDLQTLELFVDLSKASQMIVKGGINRQVALLAKKSASDLIDNLMDSHVAIGTLSRMVLADSTLYDHSATVAMLSGIIARHLMGFSRNDAELCARGGLYHDVGKTCVPGHILNKAGTLTPEEFEVMKTHTSLGYEELQKAMAQGAPIEAEVALVALEHHEKFVGGGYPMGKKGRKEEQEDGIHRFARVVTIADVYSALLMKRVYKEAYDQNQALDIMRKNAARDYDPLIWARFEKSVDRSMTHYHELDQSVLRMDGGKGRIIQLKDKPRRGA